MNILRLGDEDLVPADYSDLLEKILAVLGDRQQSETLFKLSEDRRRLLVDIDGIAAQVAQLQVQHPLGSWERLAHSATVNFTSDFAQRFPGLIRQIQGKIRGFLQQHLELKLGSDASIEKFVASLTAPLESEEFRGTGRELGFGYDFGKSYSDIEKQRLTLAKLGSGSHSLLKLHKLTISVGNTDDFQAQLREGLENYIDDGGETKSERETLNELLEEMVGNEASDFYRLVRLVDKETLGKLKKEAKIIYLEYLLEQICLSNANPEGVIYLQDLIRRLRLLEEYMNDSSRSDGDYTVNYAGIEVNYRDLFARAEVLDSLPIVPIVAGYLGETTGRQGERKFIFGLKMKFDNPVQARGGDDVFDRNVES